MGSPNTIPSPVIITGRAYVRLIEAAQLIHALTDEANERRRLERLIHHYQTALHELLEIVKPHVAAQILAASEQGVGTVQDVGLN
jgi:hypothetical protein